METVDYRSLILEDTFESLEAVDSIFGNKRPAVVSVNFTKEEPMYVIYDKYWFPMGTKVIAAPVYRPTEVKFILPDNSEQTIKII